MGKPRADFRLERARRACLAIALASCALMGAQAGLRNASPGTWLLASAVLASSLVLNCALDARLEGRRLPSSAFWLLFFFWPVALPGYWIGTRGRHGLWLVIRFALAAVAVEIGAAYLTLGLSFTRMLSEVRHHREERDEFLAGMALSDAGASALEREIAVQPDDPVLRARLIGYDFKHLDQASSRRRRTEQTVWLYEHQPASEFLRGPYAGVDVDASPGELRSAGALWERHLRQRGGDPRILENAAHFFMYPAPARSIQLFERLAAREPASPEWPERIAQVHRIAMRGKTGQTRVEIARKAHAKLLEAIALTPEARRSHLLGDAARLALEAGDDRAALEHATKLIEISKGSAHEWARAEAAHRGQVTLGRLALRSGDVARAKTCLLDAAAVSPSPLMSAMGPDLTLARELFAKGERAVVVDYLARCAGPWKEHRDQLRRWTDEIRAGRAPDLVRPGDD